MVYPFSCIYNDMDVDDYMMCPYCNIEREDLYMGGCLYCYKCPRCGSRMEVKQ